MIILIMLLLTYGGPNWEFPLWLWIAASVYQITKIQVWYLENQ